MNLAKPCNASPGRTSCGNHRFGFCHSSRVRSKSPELTLPIPPARRGCFRAIKGKIVVMRSCSLTCPHASAMRRSSPSSKRSSPPRGVVFLARSLTMTTATMAAQFVRNFMSHPVGSASRDQVVKYLGLSVWTAGWCRKVAIIDKKGNRGAERRLPAPELQDEASTCAISSTAG